MLLFSSRKVCVLRDCIVSDHIVIQVTQIPCVYLKQQLDGVPFGVLPLKPVHLPSRRAEFDRRDLSSSTTRPTGSLRENDSFEASDDFNPRATTSYSNSKPRAVMKAGITTSLPFTMNAAPVVDLLGVGGEDFTGITSRHQQQPPPQQQQQQAFDPFSGPTSGEQCADFSAGFNMAKGRANLTAHDLAKEFGSLSTASLPEASSAPAVVMPPLTYGENSLPAFHYNPGSVTNGNGGSSSSSGTSLALISLAKNDDSGEVDVDKVTASLVNLNNLLDDGTPSGTTSPTKLYSSVYADNRSLEEMKASRAARPPQVPARPIFIERTLPPRPPISPYAMLTSPLQQQQWGPPPMHQVSPQPRGSAMMGGAKYVQQEQQQMQQQLQLQQRHYPLQHNLQQQQLLGGMGGGMGGGGMQPPSILMGGGGGGGMMGRGMAGGMGGERGSNMGSAMQVPVQMQMQMAQQQHQHHQRYQQQGIPRSPKDPFFGF